MTRDAKHDFDGENGLIITFPRGYPALCNARYNILRGAMDKFNAFGVVDDSRGYHVHFLDNPGGKLDHDKCYEWLCGWETDTDTGGYVRSFRWTNKALLLIKLDGFGYPDKDDVQVEVSDSSDEDEDEVEVQDGDNN